MTIQEHLMPNSEEKPEIPQWQKETVMKRIHETGDDEWLDYAKAIREVMENRTTQSSNKFI